MEPGSFKTIEKPSQGMFRDRGSRFLSFAYPVSNEAEIKDILGMLRSRYHDARHHCYAWRLGAGMEHYRTNDDCEPSGTAGRPVMGQIQKHDLTNILIVVVRYFGGTLLGTGGLINAYRSAAADALEQAAIITKTPEEVYEIGFTYADMNQVMKVIKEEKGDLVEQDFGEKCRLRVKVPSAHGERFAVRMKLIDSVDIKKLLIIF